MAILTLQPGSGTDMTFGGTATTGDSIRAFYGNQTVSTVDLSGIGQLVDVLFGPQSGLTIGGGGTNLKCGASGSLTWAGQFGTCPVEAANTTNGSTTANTIARARQIGAGVVMPSGGNFTRLEQRSGTINSNGSATIPTFVSCGGASNTLFITGTSGFQFAVFSGGNHSTERGLDTDATSPRMIVTGGAQVTVARATLASGTITSPGTTNMPMGTGGSSSGIVGVYGQGSYLSWQGFTIDRLEVFGGARVDMSAAPVSFSVGALHTDFKSLYASNWQSKVPGVTITYSAKSIYGANDDTLPG